MRNKWKHRFAFFDVYFWKVYYIPEWTFFSAKNAHGHIFGAKGQKTAHHGRFFWVGVFLDNSGSLPLKMHHIC